MKKNVISILAFTGLSILIALGTGSCAKTSTEPPCEVQKLYLDSWIKLNYGDIQPTETGSYILKNEPGDGETVGDTTNAPYIIVEYTTRDLEGYCTATTDMKIAQRIGVYKEGDYYGPNVWSRNSDRPVYRGIEELLPGLKVGSHVVAAIPGWLITTSKYDTKEEYMSNVTNGSNAIYDFTVKGIIKDIVKWQTDSIENYLTRHLAPVEQDTAMAGFYYCRTKEPVDTVVLNSEMDIKINYVARLLNGQVVDTNIKDTAKFYNIYDESLVYSPVAINWSAQYSSITMGSNNSSLIEGFSYGLSKMKFGEKASFLFTSNLGYGYSGGGEMIPPYSPLRFDVEMFFPGK